MRGRKASEPLPHVNRYRVGFLFLNNISCSGLGKSGLLSLREHKNKRGFSSQSANRCTKM